MVSKILSSLKRLQIGRFLILPALGLTLLIAGFILRGFVPVGWLQSLHVGPVGLPAWLVQAPAASSTSLAEVVAVSSSNNLNEGTVLTTPSPTITPRTNPLELGPGVVTVLTITPTSVVRVSELEPTATIAMVSTTTLVPTVTSSLSTTFPTDHTEIRDQSASIQNELLSLNLLIGVSRIQLLAFGDSQPTDEERAAFDTNLRVVISRMEKLEDELSTDEETAGLFRSGGTVTSAQVAELITVTRDAVDLLRSEMAAHKANGADLIMAESQFGMIQEVIRHLQLMAGPTWDDLSAEQVPTPALTSTPMPLPTSPNQSSVEVDQMLAIMEGLLKQMQAILPPANNP